MQLNSSLPKDGYVAGARVRFLRRALAVSAVMGLLLAGAIGQTRTTSANSSEPDTCSNRTLRGDYGSAFDGSIVPPSPAPNLLLRGLVMTHYDGRGHFSQVDFVTVNGVAEGSDWRPATGTYEVNPDCTGTNTIIFNDGSPSLSGRFVVVDGGRQIMGIVEGVATGAIGIKVR